MKVPFAQIPATGFPGTALQVSVPLVGAVDSATPYTLTSLAITPLDGSVMTRGMHEVARSHMRRQSCRYPGWLPRLRIHPPCCNRK